ncbi:MAG: phage holin family protein [Campylobacteraceae bacterium]|jgi:hypothetical protein|nr:phage holin family protein [Campylobacteraceae bacterium]
MEKVQIDTPVSVFISALSALFAFLGLNPVQFTILAALMCFDMVTGIAKAYRLERNGVSSYRLRIGVISKILYLCVPVILALTVRGINFEFGSWLISFSVNALILAEAYSILGNIYTFKTQRKVKEIDAVSYILRAIKNQLDRLLEGDNK